MPINITMPALSPTMEEGNLAKWLVKEGDKVAPGDVIAEIETDKATMEVEAVDEGIVAKLVVPAGSEGVKVNAVIAILAGEGEDAGAAAKGGGDSAPPAKAEAKPEADASEASAKPEPKTPEPKQEVAPAKKEEAQPQPAAAQQTKTSDGTRTFASPLARRIAKDAGLDVSAVTGSGPHGRIVKADVEAAISSGGAKAAPAKAEGAAAKPVSDDAVLRFFEEPEIKFGDDLLVPDIAGWRRGRLTGFPEKNWFTIAPEGCWTKIGDRNSDDEVRAPPFDAISFSLADLWPLDPPPGLNEDPTPYYAGDR